MGNEEQQLYINATYELESLENKQILDDEEYRVAFSKLVDDVQREQFENSYIPRSEYDEKKNSLLDIMNEINSKYADTMDTFKKLEVVNKVRAIRERQKLKLIKRYYERLSEKTNHQRNMMRNVDVDNMSDDEVISLYRNIYYGLGHEKVQQMINGNIVVKNESENVDVVVAPSNEETVSLSATNGTDTAKNDIDEEINKFNLDSSKILTNIEKVRQNLVLSDTDLDVSKEIREISEDLKILDDEVKSLISMIDEFSSSLGSSNFSMTPVGIRNKLDLLKNKFKDLKGIIKCNYNARVEAVNDKIEQLKSLKDLDEETLSLVNQLEIIPICDARITKQVHLEKLLEKIDYNKLFQMEKLISEVNNKMGKITLNDMTDSLDIDIEHIESEIERIDINLNLEINNDNRLLFMSDVLTLCDAVNAFRIKVENNKDKISKADYQKYLDRINDAEIELADLNIRIQGFNNKEDKTEKEFDNNKAFVNGLKVLYDEVSNFDLLVSSLVGCLNIDGVNALEAKLKDYEGRLENIKKEIDGKSAYLEKNQYESLNKKCGEIENLIKNVNNKLKSSDMVTELNDIYSLLDGRIEGVESVKTALDKLEQLINNHEKVIKDRKIRKEVEKLIKGIEEEIQEIEKELETYKDVDTDKYNASKEKLEVQKERLAKLSKDYRKKCPLLVKAVKSAKEFYKKHKKLCLFAAGLAAIALLHATVGPILIPAIMQGNIMMGFSSPALRGFATSANKILGGLIGATCDNGVWSLANGVIINPSVASTSLLKGLAISSVGTAGILGTGVALGRQIINKDLITSIKNLVEKMKKFELKEKLNKGKETIKNKVKTEKNKLKENINNTKNDVKEKISNAKDKLKDKITDEKRKENKDKLKEVKYYYDLYAKFVKSGLSFEEFCEKEKISDDEIESFNQVVNAFNPIERGGRK